MHHMLDYDDLDGARLLLEAGADADDGALHHAILRDRDVRFVDLLVEHGADLERRNRDSLTLYALAVRRNRGDIAERLAALGVAQTAGPVDVFLAAARRGDSDAVGAALAENPRLV
jgi:ankyrin repeat protein